MDYAFLRTANPQRPTIQQTFHSPDGSVIVFYARRDQLPDEVSYLSGVVLTDAMYKCAEHFAGCHAYLGTA